MKIRPLFNQYQKFLLAFVNTDFGRDYIAVGKKREKQPIIKITPDSVHYLRHDGLIEADFYPRSPYINKFATALASIDIVQEAFGEIESFATFSSHVVPNFQGLITPRWDMPKVMFSNTFYPDANVESTSVDGIVARHSVNEAFSTIRNGAGTLAADSDATREAPRLIATTTSNQWGQLRRGIYLFDTSSLNDSMGIKSSTLSIHLTVVNDVFNQSVSICSSNPASNTALVNSDYAIAGFGSTKLSSDVDLGNISGGYVNFALNSSGITNISKTGISKFGTRFSGDMDNSAPTWSSGADNYTMSVFSDNGTNKPTLTTIYVPSGGSPMFFSGGVTIG